MKTAHIFPRHCHADLPVAMSGEGSYIIDEQGKRYFDACGGAAVSCLGHNHQTIKQAMRAQIESISYAHTSFFTSKPAEELAQKLSGYAGGDLNRVYFVSGGSEAMEAALKLAKQYFVEKGQPQRHHIIARWQSYHGNTLGALSAGGNRWRRNQFEDMLVPSMSHVSPCHAWRWKNENESEAEYVERLVQELEGHILEIGADKVAAFVAEPVVGATMGAVPASKGYFKAVKQVCDRCGILLILDEVMCGMGRTGSLFAFEQEGVIPDIVVIAKGLGAGYQPIGAMIVDEKIYKAIYDGSGFFQHGHTYLGHPLACAASLAVLNTIIEGDLLKNVKRRGQQLKKRLEDDYKNHDFIAHIRGRGLFIGLEIVKDKNTKEPFDPSLGLASKIKKEAMKKGLMIYPMSGTVNGQKGDHILLAPAFIISEEEVDLIADRLLATLDRVFDGLCA